MFQGQRDRHDLHSLTGMLQGWVQVEHGTVAPEFCYGPEEQTESCASGGEHLKG